MSASGKVGTLLGPEFLRLISFSCSTQLNMKFILLINWKHLTSIRKINTTSECFKNRRKYSFFIILVFDEQLKFHVQISWAWKKFITSYEGCSNMNASGFITFFTYMLRQNGNRFYKGLYVTFKVTPALKKNTVYLSSYCPLNEGHVCILINSMLRTYTVIETSV